MYADVIILIADTHIKEKSSRYMNWKNWGMEMKINVCKCKSIVVNTKVKYIIEWIIWIYETTKKWHPKGQKGQRKIRYVEY